MAIIFGFLAIVGFIGIFFFPWYEADWAVEYYNGEYGEGAYQIILSGIKIATIIYGIIAILTKVIATKVDPVLKSVNKTPH